MENTLVIGYNPARQLAACWMFPECKITKTELYINNCSLSKREFLIRAYKHEEFVYDSCELEDFPDYKKAISVCGFTKKYIADQLNYSSARLSQIINGKTPEPFNFRTRFMLVAFHNCEQSGKIYETMFPNSFLYDNEKES